MTISGFDTYVFDNGQLVPFQEAVRDQLQWEAHLEQQGYAPEEKVWGQYPDAYLKVNEARPGAVAAYRFVATLNLVNFPHHIFVRDLNGLIQLLRLVLPLFDGHSRPHQAAGEDLFGSQGSDESAETGTRLGKADYT
jgi:hypothetical protein